MTATPLRTRIAEDDRRCPPPDAPVVRHQRPRLGLGPEDVPRYGDDRWDLAPFIHTPSLRHEHVVDWLSIADRARREPARQYLYARLNERLVPRAQLLAASSAVSQWRGVRRFFEYLDDRWEGMPLASVDQAVYAAYLAELRRPRAWGAALSTASQSLLVHAVKSLWSFRGFMLADALRIEPWPGRSSNAVVGRQAPKENTTPRIPPEVMAGVLRWALFYVETASVDILAASEELSELERRTRRGGLPAMEAFVASRRRQGRGMPALVEHRKVTRALTGPVVNTKLAHLLAGTSRTRATEAALALAVKELGLEDGGLDTAIAALADGRPWRPRFSPDALAVERRMLLAACYVVGAYLSGMRNGEVQALRRGCHFREASADGVLVRHKLAGLTFKGRHAEGEPATWVVIEPVAKAIAALESLHDGDVLFVRLAHAQINTVLGTDINLYLNEFCARVNDRYSTPDAPAISPGPDGQQWRLTARQFRRTIAWHIANQPFGVVAGAIQYKHLSVAAFEGYAGNPAGGFRDEVEAELAFARIADIVARYEEHRAGARSAGPGAARVNAEFDRIADELGDLPGTVIDHGRLRSMLHHLATTLHPGILNDCFFDPAVALCLAGVDPERRQEPALTHCVPGRCPNARLTERHAPAWEHGIASAKVLLTDKRLSVHQRGTLNRHVAEMSAVATRLGPDQR